MTKHSYGTVASSEAEQVDENISAAETYASTISNSAENGDHRAKYPKIWRSLLAGAALNGLSCLTLLCLLASNQGDQGKVRAGALITGFVELSFMSSLCMFGLRTERFKLPLWVEKYCCKGLDEQATEDDETVLWSSTTQNPAMSNLL